MEDYKYIFLTILFFAFFYKSKYHFLLDKAVTEYFFILFKDKEDKDKEKNANIATNIDIKTVIKYEDKYLEDIKNFSKEFVLTEEQIKLKCDMMFKFYNEFKSNYELQVNTIYDNIANNEILLNQYTNDLLAIQSQSGVIKDDEEIDEEIDEDELNELINDVLLDNQNLYKKLEALKLENTDNKLFIKANNLAYSYVYNDYFNKFVNNFVIEKTPVGNVLMFYNNEKKAFQYYSDNTVPYKYLEVVARKYVKVFKCRCLYINMEDEMKIVHSNFVENNINSNKNIFAKFKTYNQSSNSDKSAMVAPPKNNIVRNNNSQPVNKDIVLKDNANHFICSGKFVNFPFIKPVKKELVDKKLTIKYSDFKNMNKVL